VLYFSLSSQKSEENALISEKAQKQKNGKERIERNEIENKTKKQFLENNIYFTFSKASPSRATTEANKSMTCCFFGSEGNLITTRLLLLLPISASVLVALVGGVEEKEEDD
jgi:hypothetical protein